MLNIRGSKEKVKIYSQRILFYKDKWHLFIQILFWFHLTKDKSKKTISSHICPFICGLNWMQDQNSPSDRGVRATTLVSETQTARSGPVR